VIALEEGNVVTMVKTQATDGYDAVQVGYKVVQARKVRKPELGHLQKAGCEPMKHLREFKVRAAAAAVAAVAPAVVPCACCMMASGAATYQASCMASVCCCGGSQQHATSRPALSQAPGMTGRQSSIIA
jgi:hypothetical protein